MNDIRPNDLLEFDRDHIWHPYTSLRHPLPVYKVVSADGVRLRLDDGSELIDGMASWWAVIHGYNHPVINKALKEQMDRMSHVMFGGLTHEPAIMLAKKLIDITHERLQNVFFSDSGSVAVEVALKMAFQFWQAYGKPEKSKILSLRGGYHGDTFGAMSVCDPVTGMHTLFRDVLAQHIFAPRPTCRFDDEWDESCFTEFAKLAREHKDKLAAVILEPVVQGAGGMYFYSPLYLDRVRTVCDECEILLIYDEIATGFGRTGKLFAYEHASSIPDILCLGKALTGGTMSLAATLSSQRIADTISSAEPGVFMHGPTFMANPLACTAAYASIDLLLSSAWHESIDRIQTMLTEILMECREFPHVTDVRTLGAIGVIEMKQAVDVAGFQRKCVEKGVWIRPFGKLVYIMPPYRISSDDLSYLAITMKELVAQA